MPPAGVAEENLQRTAWKVLRFINRLHEHPLGNPLKNLPKRTRKTLSDESLRERIGQVSIEDATGIVIQICEGLNEAHSVGIVIRVTLMQ